MILVAYMQKKDGLLKREGSNETFIVEQGHIPLLQEDDYEEEEEEEIQQMKEINKPSSSSLT